MNQGPAALQYVWVRLVQNGTLSASTMLVFKPEFGIWNNDALKEAAKLKFPARLQGLDADLLEVRATIDGPVLRPSQAPPDSAQQDDTPLFIFDPRPVTTSGSTDGDGGSGGGDGGGRSSSAGASESILMDKVDALSIKMGALSVKMDAEMGALSVKMDSEMGALSVKMGAEMGRVVQATGMVMRKALCPWDRTSHSRSHAAANILTPGVLAHYGFGGDFQRCHLCGHVDGAPHGPKAVIITAHIFPNHTGGDGLHLFGLKRSDIDIPRNFLRLHNQVEKAFDSRRLTIVHHGGRLCAYLLDPSLRATRLAGTNPSLTFGQCHLRALTFLNDERPFRRLLAAHAADCFAHAESMGWIGEQQESEWEMRFKELASFSLDDAKQENIKQWLLAGRSVQQEADNAGAGAAATATGPDM